MDKWMVFIIEPTRLHWFTLYRCIWQTVLSILFNMASMFLAAIIMVKIIFQRLTKSLQRTWHIMTYHHPAERLGWCEDKEMTTGMTCLNYQSMGYTYIYIHIWLVIWNMLKFSPIVGMMIQSDSYFSEG